jgi:DNA-binding transcriptional ArsR family regulator
MDITKALADESRVRVLLLLHGRELCVCQIVEVLGLAPSTVSKHMAILRQARLVEARKEGRWMHYRRAEGQRDPHVAEALRWVDEALARDPRTREDARTLTKVLKTPPEDLCRRQAGACAPTGKAAR